MQTPWDEIKCPVCGKAFVPAPLHAWKIDISYCQTKRVCTYSCMRVWEKGEGANGKPKRRRATKTLEAQLQGV